jgi:hypothetical protein
MHIVALVWGILALGGMFIGFVPCLGALNWINSPFAAIGLAISYMAYTKATPETRTLAQAGLVMNGVAVVFGFVRLMAGGGIL